MRGGLKTNMKKVAMFDLRTNDAWDVDFVLVEHSLVHSTNMDTIMYFDRCGDPVYFSGGEYEASDYYARYCAKKGLEFIPYELMERMELDELRACIQR